mmetsp:Transcript_59706/g.99051  ORF Transcript_59706/g.99051 Transcript_59706/m.99051 type:complete len:578 (+) Transcript_59706:115-1848(+)
MLRALASAFKFHGRQLLVGASAAVAGSYSDCLKIDLEPATAKSLRAALEAALFDGCGQKLPVSLEDQKTLQATENDGARVALLKSLFKTLYGDEPECISMAGGRVNLIGEHVDYPDVQFAGDPVVHLFSMGGAIQNNYLVAAGARTDGKVVICHTAVGEVFTVTLAELDKYEAEAVTQRERHMPMKERSTPQWAFHTLGAVKQMISSGVQLPGLNLLLTSNVPHGAGMSNSAANCVALGLVFNNMFPALKLDSPIDLVTFARRAENSSFAGGSCGWLDQLLIVCSNQGMLTKIDYADRSVQHFKSKLPADWQFVALNTNVPHVLAESDYSHRVRELTLGVEFLSKLRGKNTGGPSLKLGTINALLTAIDPDTPGNDPIDIASLSDGALAQFDTIKGEAGNDLSASEVQEVRAAVEASFVVPEDLPLHKGKTPLQSFGIILRRMRHQKMSSLLVPLAGEAAEIGDAALFGALLDLEGQSLRMSGDFMITGENGAQDAMLDCALAAGKELKIRVHGRMLGGGGGGNVLLFVDMSDVTLRRQWEGATCAKYNAWAEAKFPGQGIKATTIVPEISAGARLL